MVATTCGLVDRYIRIADGMNERSRDQGPLTVAGYSYVTEEGRGFRWDLNTR